MTVMVMAHGIFHLEREDGLIVVTITVGLVTHGEDDYTSVAGGSEYQGETGRHFQYSFVFGLAERI